MEIKSVAVIGLGLIGGSIAKAVRRIPSVKTVIGIDTDKDILNTALRQGVLDKTSKVIDNSVGDADIVFVCTPIERITECIKMLVGVVKKDCIITDTGSIKGSIISEINKLNGDFIFIGGHPMCGSEKAGFESSRKHLFENAYYILTTADSTTENALKILEEIIIEFGANPVIIDNRKHDLITGAISHFPHIVSAALVNLVKHLDKNENYMRTLAAGGFKDITRISSSNPEMWKSIVIRNKDIILNIIDSFLELFNEFKSWLSKNEQDSIYKYFESAKEYRDSFSSENIGLIRPLNDITVDVRDRPGEIGRIATLLGENNVNIKNINVSNSRENDNGCLRISLSDVKSTNDAYGILKENGYNVYKI